jgi:dienelactone hydrolase
MQFRAAATEHGVTERRFDLEVSGEVVPGLLWTPAGADGPRPLVLFGHGGTQHKRTEGILALARSLVRHRRYAAMALDAPRHGERMKPEDAERYRSMLREFKGRLPALTDEQLRAARATVPQAVAEWRAALDAVEQLPEVGSGNVGYWGLSMGCGIGVPLVAREPRIKAAVLGLGALRSGDDELARTAGAVRIPLQFIFQLDDELMTPEGGLALFAAFGSEIKTMHINPGPHVAVPAFQRDAAELFFARHLGQGS